MKLTPRIAAACLGAGALALMANASVAATPAPAAAASTAKPTTPKVLAKPRASPARTAGASVATAAVDPAAMQAMSRMAGYLHTLKSFQITAATERDEVDDFGQLLTFSGQTIYKIRSPDAFSINVSEGDKARQFVYDGKSLIVFAPRLGFYAKVDAPPTIRQTLDVAAQKYGVSVPLDDLFTWDRGSTDHANLTSAHVVGPARVGDKDAMQYAFRQAGVDWQIWIASGDKPVPLRVVIVASDDPAHPQFESRLDWNTEAQFAADTFAFSPPAEAKLIAIQSSGR